MVVAAAAVVAVIVSSSSSSGSEDDDDEGTQGKGDEGKMIMGSWKVINVYLEEDRGGKKVRVRRYKCPGEGVWGDA